MILHFKPVTFIELLESISAMITTATLEDRHINNKWINYKIILLNFYFAVHASLKFNYEFKKLF